MWGLIKEIRAAVLSEFAPHDPRRFNQMELCVLPLPIQAIKQQKIETPPDAYLENKETNKWGFNTATAIMRSEGSTPDLTAYDVHELKARDIWANERTKRGRVANAQKARAKKEWHDGLSSVQISGVMGVSESWAEKHCAAFAAALSAERGETA